MTGRGRALALGMLSLLGGVLRGQGGGTQTRTIPDPIWGMAAATVTLPAGWKFDGMATHGDGCVTSLPDVRWAASSPDGSMQVQYYPQITYVYSSNQGDNAKSQGGGCLVTQFFKPEDFLSHVAAPRLRPGTEPHTQAMGSGNAVLQQLQAVAAQQDRSAASHGIAQHTDVSFAGVVMEFPRGNTAMAETFQGVFTCTQMQFRGSPVQSVRCTIDDAMTFTGPESQLAEALRQPGVHAKLKDAWEQRGMQMLQARYATQNAEMQKMFANDRQGQLALGQTLMDNQRAQYEAGVKRNQMTENARHESAVGTINHMGDVNDYADPTTGKSYKVSNQYSHTYLDSTGKTILQTNSAYAPGPDTVWQELQPHP